MAKALGARGTVSGAKAGTPRASEDRLRSSDSILRIMESHNFIWDQCVITFAFQEKKHKSLNRTVENR